MMKKAIIFLALLAANACALNDAILTVDSQGAGICLGLDSLETAACNNQTLVLSGESDHFVYILPGQEVASNATMKEKLTFMFVGSGGFLTGNFAYALILTLMIITAALLIVLLVRKFILGGG